MYRTKKIFLFLFSITSLLLTCDSEYKNTETNNKTFASQNKIENITDKKDSSKLELPAKGVFGEKTSTKETNQKATPNFSLVREFTSEEAFTKARKLIRNISISSDRKVISYEFEGTLKRINLVEPFLEEVNNINISPNEEYFSAYQEGKSYTSNIYLYSINGELIKKLPLNIYPNIKFSSNGKYISLANLFGKSYFIYDSGGQKITSQVNYQNLIKSKKAPLEHVSISPDKNSVLLFADKLYLLNSKDDQILWTIESTYVFGTLFLDDVIVLLCDSGRTASSIKLISVKNGKILNEIKNVEKVSINEINKIVFSKNKKYYEYEIK